MSDTYERIATDASFNTSPSLPAIHKAADALAARLETLTLIERRGE
jgi:hypothetical protein